jgi:mRNA interferase RelE/StbE
VAQRVNWSKPAQRDRAALEPTARARVDAAVLRFAEQGQGDVKALKGRAGEYRLRVGDLRVRFTIDLPRQEIIILAVAHRREAYR